MTINPNLLRKRETPRRVRVASEVKRVLSEFLLRGTLNSDNSSGENMSMASMIAITGVEMSPDLQYSKIFIASVSPKISVERCIDFLELNKYKLRNQLGASIRLKRVPELHFFVDNSFEEGEKIENILKKLDIPSS
ncbi:MAG: 30S ribosome-binding factor RbfA [Alphaproteobacteria bacterium]|nr:30S ribosome-binding factor RbfA [Alphaproteobacteria bacterium]